MGLRFLTAILFFSNSLVFALNPLAYFSRQAELGQEGAETQWQRSLASSILSLNPNFLPIRNWEINEPEMEARSAIIYLISGNKDKETALLDYKGIRREGVLYERHKNWVLPIASLTKLMTAIVVVENMDLESIATVSQKAIDTYGYRGNFKPDEQISVENLLYAMLLESSNDAAVALAEHYNRDIRVFVDLMNKKARDLGLENTFFAEPSGLDSTNVSTAEELAQIVEYSFREPIIWRILKTPDIALASADGRINHYWTNTDVLLNRLPNVLGGKTGYTDEAQGCLILVIEQEPDKNKRGPELKEYLISVVLGAEEKFLETQRLIQWAGRAYKWQ